jgi:hypothetical protein
MARRRLKVTVIVTAVVLLAVGIAFIYSRADNSLGGRVKKILITDMLPGANNWNEGMDKLWTLGPGVIPCLADEAGQRDTFFSKKYAQLWTNSPSWIKQHVPRPINRPELRSAAMHAIAEFGPLAARRAAPQVIAALKEKDFWHQNYSVECLRWLLPDSKATMAAFKYGLAGTDTNWPMPQYFLNIPDDAVEGDSVWARVPEVVPLLTNLLHDSGHAYHAAIALGRIGSNAAPAIPALIETVDIGAAGFTDTKSARNHVGEGFSNPLGVHAVTMISDDKSMNHNRGMAALALGRIGVATPEVCAALARAWNAHDPWVRHNAGLAVALLGPPMTNELPALLQGLKDVDNMALGSKLIAIGKLGPNARDALATLRELTDTNQVLAQVTNKNVEIVGWSIVDLSASAKMAIVEIDPGQGRALLPDIAAQIGRRWDAVECLANPGPLSNDIVRVVEPLLDGSDVLRQSAGAYIILSHDKNHAKAWDVLHRNKADGEINPRLLAGRLLYQTVGETNRMCALIAEAFQDSRSFPGQNAGQIAEKMGTNALPALPAIKAALWHKDRFVRERAGTLILKLAPEELPINEPK